MMQKFDSSIIALDKFIRATRDSGYKNTVSAVSELVDNSIQASANNIEIEIFRSDNGSDYPIHFYVLDDGHGMPPKILREALRFGGSTRFNDRNGLGRYGMGLPNASLSQAKCLEVYTWDKPNSPYYSYLDVDEIAAGDMASVPAPKRLRLPKTVNGSVANTGTLVIWSSCDRLDNKRHTTLVRKLKPELGRIFRYFIWDGVKIRVNGEEIIPVDPLYLREPSVTYGGKLFTKPIIYEVRAPSSNGTGEKIANITVRFSELPVHKWHHLSNDEKRQMGISNGAGISIVRGGREVDYGWFFCRGKRRENYDDWWRAEVQFDPELDELFGITHTKQQIRPSERIYEIFGDDLADTARALNARIRRSHQGIKERQLNLVSEEMASKRDLELKDIEIRRTSPEEKEISSRLDKRHPDLIEPNLGEQREYRIIEDDLGEYAFFTPVLKDNRIALVVNPKHRFYKLIYKPMIDGQIFKQEDLVQLIQLLLLSAGRAEAAMSKVTDRRIVTKFRKEWSEVLNTFLKP